MSPALHNLWLLLVLKNLTPHKISSEYEKLWAAVTGGRGTGRGTKKKIVKGVDPKLLKFGRCGSIIEIEGKILHHLLCLMIVLYSKVIILALIFIFLIIVYIFVLFFKY